MIVQISVVLGIDLRAVLDTIEGIELMRHATHKSCQICNKPFVNDGDPASLWLGLAVARELNTIVVLPMHRECTQGMDSETVHKALIEGMQRNLPSLGLVDAPEQEPEPERDLEVIILPEAQAQMDAIEADHPGLKEAVREFTANMRQAQHAVRQGRYASIADAVEAITGQRPMPVTDLDDLEADDED